MWLTAHSAALELVGALVLHLAIGAPVWLKKAHPARLFVWLEKFFEGLLREKMGFELRRAGGVLALLCLLAAFLLGFLLGGVGWPLRVILISYAFTCPRIFLQPRKTLKALRAHDLTKARAALSEYIRIDTDRMTEREAVTASVTYVGHALCDAFAAPLFWIFIGSLLGLAAPFALMWICVDSLDARIGSKTRNYGDIGWFSAKLSDVAGFVPAYLSGWSVIVASAMLRLNSRRAIRVMDHDHKAHSSPNGGWAVAALSGALGIQLGGDVRINGVVMHRRMIGEYTRMPETEDIARALRVLCAAVAGSTLLSFVILALLRA